MSGALAELAAAGPQDQIDSEERLFQPKWAKTPNFSRAPRVVPLEGNPDFGSRRCVVEIPRDGDLLHRVYLRVGMPALQGTAGACESCGVEIG